MINLTYNNSRSLISHETKKLKLHLCIREIYESHCKGQVPVCIYTTYQPGKNLVMFKFSNGSLSALICDNFWIFLHHCCFSEAQNIMTVSACRWVRYLSKKKVLLGMKLNCVWWWYISFGAMEIVEYSIFAITPSSTLTRYDNTYKSHMYVWSRSFWKSFVLDRNTSYHITMCPLNIRRKTENINISVQCTQMSELWTWN